MARKAEKAGKKKKAHTAELINSTGKEDDGATIEPTQPREQEPVVAPANEATDTMNAIEVSVDSGASAKAARKAEKEEKERFKALTTAQGKSMPATSGEIRVYAESGTPMISNGRSFAYPAYMEGSVLVVRPWLSMHATISHVLLLHDF